MSVDYRLQAILEARSRERQLPSQMQSGLQGGGGGDNSGGMEVRIARLEADMDHVKRELAKLSSVPVDLATLTERVSHLPTRTDVDAAIDRAGTRTQRTIAIAGGLVTLAMAAITYLPKVIG